MEIPDEIFQKHGWVDINVYLFVKRNPEASLRRIALEFDMTKGRVETVLKRLREDGFFPGKTSAETAVAEKKKRKIGKNSESQTARTGDSMEERRSAFVEDLKPYLAKYGREMLNRFYQYWTQVNPGRKKMLFERQKAFEIGKRLATWRRNSDGLAEDLIFRDTEKDYNKNLW